MFHKLTVVGAIGNDPQSNTTSNGTNVTNFNIPLSIWRGGDNYETEWLKVTAWGDMATRVANNFRKRDRVLIELEFDRIEQWQSNGETNARTAWRLTNIRKVVGADQLKDSGGNHYPQQPPKAGTGINELDNDIPF